MPTFFDMSRKIAVGELPEIGVPAGGRRARNVQRLQVGVAGVVLMIMLVGLASVIQNRAAETDATAVPEAAPTTEPSALPQRNDPLVEAGVVPDLPTQPTAAPAPAATAQNRTDEANPAD